MTRSAYPPIRLSALAAILAVSVVACSHKPPENFAPDPILAGKLRSINILTRVDAACPGGLIPTDYEAVHESGLHYPVSRVYNKKNPPKLHVVFLNRTSPDAVSTEGGDWVADPDPLQTVMTGFRLTACCNASMPA